MKSSEAKTPQTVGTMFKRFRRQLCRSISLWLARGRKPHSTQLGLGTFRQSSVHVKNSKASIGLTMLELVMDCDCHQRSAETS